MKSRLYEEVRHMLRENGIDVEILNQNPNDITDFDILIDFSEHNKKVTEEKDKKIAELEKELSKANDIYRDLRSRVTADAIEYFMEKKYDRLVITLPENMANAKRNIELEDRHQSDCIEINRLHTALEVMTEKYMKLREVHGL